ncbi:hypothetical protein [Flavonifractor sp. An82]|uniref:hypothetical protein n=1 Tax=Flavonifractor sp. An82 TaxID=1965660 RepID=UPI0011233451|nr:hypothetical protein [Flavonifractor sp. An82]
MASEIRTLKDGDIEIHPRTVAKAVHTSSGSTIDVEIKNAKAETDAKLGDVNTVLENILSGSTLEEVNTKIDQIKGDTSGITTMEKLEVVDSTKADLKTVLAEKGQSVNDVFSTYPAAVRAIKTGIDTSDATAVASDILTGKTAYGASGKITGTIPTQGAQTITPGTSNKTIASGRYLTGTQTIKGDANLVAANIKKGISIFGVAGSFEGGSTIISDYSSTTNVPFITTGYSMTQSQFNFTVNHTIKQLLGFVLNVRGGDGLSSSQATDVIFAYPSYYGYNDGFETCIGCCRNNDSNKRYYLVHGGSVSVSSGNTITIGLTGFPTAFEDVMSTYLYPHRSNLEIAWVARYI